MELPGVSYNPYKWSEITPFITIGSGSTLSILFVCDVWLNFQPSAEAAVGFFQITTWWETSQVEK